MDGARYCRRLAATLVAACALVSVANAQQRVPSAPVESFPVDDGPIFASPPVGPELCGPEIGPGMMGGGPTGPWETGPSPRPWLLRQLDLRHSSTHGRAMGPGSPLRGTSWLNRPFAFSLDGGALLMGGRPSENVRSGNDFFAAIGVGWDWDHYWGSQIRFGWSSPELLNTTQTTVDSDDNLLVTDLSFLYYPWGDSRMRPYWRVGVGLTDLEYTNDLGRRQHNNLLTIPFGAGLKYQFNRHVAWRLELMDNLAFGQNETDTLNNFTITGGIEWRFGGKPEGSWGWAPRGGGW